ncbi:MAG TPA: hypothetical protein PLV45_15195, partial [bacterium]|nr:hypothetical protein [bacterium]
MNKRDTHTITRKVVNVMLALFTGIAMRYIRVHSGLPLEGIRGMVFDWTFPVSMVVFHLFTGVIASPGRQRLARVIDQWSAVWVFPFLLMGLSWRYWESWPMAAAGIHWIYIVFRMSGMCLVRQTPGTSRSMDDLDFAVYAASAALLKMYAFTGPGSSEFADFVFVPIVAAGYAWLAAVAAGRIAGEGFSGTLWQRATGGLLIVSQPVLSIYDQLNGSTIPVLGLLLFLAFYRRTGTLEKIVMYTGAAVVITLAPISNPGLLLLGAWMTATVIADSRQTRSANTGMLIGGGFAVLFVAAALLTYLRIRGHFPSGDTVYPVPGIAAWPAPFIDRARGLMHASPW